MHIEIIIGEMKMNQRNTLSIYACGGTGINLSTKVISIPTSATGFPEVEHTLIDTSESNMDAEGKKGKNVYLIPGLEGAGKERRFGYENAEPHINPILTKFKPKDVSIVIFSLSGGSGSVLGPLIIRELLDRDLDVIAFCIGNCDNGKEADNSLKTISTLQGISSKSKKPIIARFYHNDNKSPRGQVDVQIENDIRGLAMLLSGFNRELDNRDIHNFLHYNMSTGLPAQLVDLIVYAKTEKSEDPSGFTAIGIASLLTNKEDMLLNMGQPYGCVGYMPSGITEAFAAGVYPLHFILTNALINERIEKYKKSVEEFTKAKEQLASMSILKIAENCDEGGFVF